MIRFAGVIVVRTLTGLYRFEMSANPHRSSRLSSRPASARERIDQTAYELFSRHGIHAVGVDTISARSGVAKMTLYKHYRSKQDLALAFLRRREELWTHSWLQHEVERRARAPAARLLAVFDVFDKWFRRSDFEACSFAKVLLEHSDPGHPVRKAAEAHIGTIRAFLRELAADAGVRDADAFARQLQIVMMGSIIAAYAGDRDAARRAKELGSLLLARAGIRTGQGPQA
jgi:AcrR family transcriptional regulator